MFNPNPTTSNLPLSADGSLIPNSTRTIVHPVLDVRLLFALESALQNLLDHGGPVQPLTKRQREILDYLNEFIEHHGYAPSLEEIGRRFGLSSLATVHKHLSNLQEKGFIKRTWNRSRSVELMPTRSGARARDIPLLGRVSAGEPIEAVLSSETISVPEEFLGKRDTYALRVKGDSMVDEQIRNNDIVILEDRKTVSNGETVVALIDDSEATLKTYYLESNQVRLQPQNQTMTPIILDIARVQVQGVVIGVMRRYRHQN
mgnify:CR=1 FL=1